MRYPSFLRHEWMRSGRIRPSDSSLHLTPSWKEWSLYSLFHRLLLAVSKIKVDGLVLFAIALSLLNFIPLLINADFHLEGSKEESEYRSRDCVVAILCSLCVLSPLVIDMVLDFIYVPKTYLLYLYLRTMSLAALLLYDIVYLTTLNMKKFTLYFGVLDNFQYMITIVVSILFFRDLDTKDCWTNGRIVVLLLLYFSYYLFAVIDLMYPSTLPFYDIWRPLPGYIFLICCLLVSARWLYRLVEEFRVKNLNISVANISFKDGYTIILMLSGLLMVVVYTVLMILYDMNSKEYRVGMIAMSTVYIFIVALLPGRMIRQAANDILLLNETTRLDAEMLKLQTDLRMKRNFVCHVSHEIRTPLSTVFSGLELISSKLCRLKSHSKLMDEVLEDMQCVSSSCDAALLILNDLLSYEKLESGLMMLERSKALAEVLKQQQLRPEPVPPSPLATPAEEDTTTHSHVRNKRPYPTPLP